jgi:outer membrane biosynthesis protein TonB
MLSVSFVSRGKTPFVVRLHPRNVRELIESMFTHAGWSVLKSSDSASTDSTIFAEEALDTAHAAKLLPPLRSPRYPTQLQTRGVPGEVWARYVIDTTGRMEPGSVEVLYTTNPLFAENAIQALKDQRFTPARRYGRPVRMQAYRTWSFIVPGI